MNQVKGLVFHQVKVFVLYIAVIAVVALTVFINWIKEEEDIIDERVGYESGRYEHED